MNRARVHAAIRKLPFDAADLRRNLPEHPSSGGYCSFEGWVRNENHCRPVVALEYEAFDELAVKELRRCAEEALEQYGVDYVQVVHRTGRLVVGDVAVLIQVLSGHRAEAFAACRYIIDQLKQRAPIWKREEYADGTHEWTRCTHANPHSRLGADA